MSEKIESQALLHIMSQVQDWLFSTLEHGFGELLITVRIPKGTTREVTLKRGKTIRMHVREEEIPKG